jgi:uncharacterized protein (TIGR00304 family)
MLDLVIVGIAVIFFGFVVVLLATVASGNPSGEGERRSEVKGGGVILIGPIPIVFGSDAKWASIAIVLAIVLIVLAVLSGAVFGL